MTEPTRRLPDPEVNADGKLVGKSVLTPQEMKTRGAIAVPSTKVIPVIMVPGIMGSNLRANTNKKAPQNTVLRPGQPAWRPPNGKVAGLKEAGAWEDRDPRIRQGILDGDTLEVDDSGLIEMPDDKNGQAVNQMRARWWGEVHWDSYGGLLGELHLRLNNAFTTSFFSKKPIPNDFWESIMEYDLDDWNAPDMAPLSEKELQKYAQYQYPVYACGYNWTQSNEKSGQRLKQRVLDVIKFWTDRKFDCKQVILVTHSMGGLVGRACAKQIPDKIAGIVHGVMPALGAPLAYRRMACGTETSAPGKGPIDNYSMEKFADIAGDTPAKTTPAMATACGALELLPNHLYPGPWLFSAVKRANGTIENIGSLQHSNVYDLYRDFDAWFRMIDPALADPAGKYADKTDGAVGAILQAVNQAEKFHRTLLGAYYHPNTYAYYGADPDQQSFGTFRWITDDESVRDRKVGMMLPAAVLGNTNFTGGRNIAMPKLSSVAGRSFFFYAGAQDTPGDGTVSQQSGAGPQGKIKRLFRTVGYDHQGSYADDHMLALTHHLIVRIAQEAK